jgi:hypothetical protein
LRAIRPRSLAIPRRLRATRPGSPAISCWSRGNQAQVGRNLGLVVRTRDEKTPDSVAIAQQSRARVGDPMG